MSFDIVVVSVLGQRVPANHPPPPGLGWPLLRADRGLEAESGEANGQRVLTAVSFDSLKFFQHSTVNEENVRALLRDSENFWWKSNKRSMVSAVFSSEKPPNTTRKRSNGG